MKRYSYLLTTAAVGVVLVTFAALVGVTMASPPSGVTPTLLARGAYEDFKVKAIPDSPVDFQVKAKSLSTSSSEGTTMRLDRIQGGTAIRAWSSSRSPRAR